MHKKVIAIILSPTFFLFAMVLNTSTTAAKVDPPQWTFDDKEAKDELKKWVNFNQLKPLELDTVKDGSGNGEIPRPKGKDEKMLLYLSFNLNTI